MLIKADILENLSDPELTETSVALLRLRKSDWSKNCGRLGTGSLFNMGGGSKGAIA
jgi:hypothetical protein